LSGLAFSLTRATLEVGPTKIGATKACFTLSDKEFLFWPHLLGDLNKTEQNSECHTYLYMSNSNKFEPVWTRASTEQVGSIINQCF